MTRRAGEINEADLAKRLRAEADHDGLAFSEELHARIMGQVRQAPREETPRSPASWRWAAVGLAAAAAILLAIWMGAGRESGDDAGPLVAHQPAPQPRALPVVAVNEVLEQAARPARDRLEEGRFAYLDRDAKRLADYVMAQLPGTPSSQ